MIAFTNRFSDTCYKDDKEQSGFITRVNALDTHHPLCFGGAAPLFDPYRTTYTTQLFGQGKIALRREGWF